MNGGLALLDPALRPDCNPVAQLIRKVEFLLP